MRIRPLLVPDFFEISYRADLDVLGARWLRPIELPQMQQGYQLLLDAAQAGNCRRWLLDVRRRLNTHQLGAQWMVSSFLPLLGDRLGGRTQLAYLLAPLNMRDSAADSAFTPPSYFVGKPFVGERFIEENAAIEWLHQDLAN